MLKKYLFIHACIFLKTLLGAKLLYLLNILNTSHIEHLLNTYYAASARDLPETNKQIIANTLGCHNLIELFPEYTGETKEEVGAS